LKKNKQIFISLYIYSEREGVNFIIILAQKVKVGLEMILSFQTILSNSQKLAYQN